MGEDAAVWEFFGYDGGIVEVARADCVWRVRRGCREERGRHLDAALERLLGLSNLEIARLAVEILEWDSRAARDTEAIEPAAERVADVVSPRVSREVASLRRLLEQEEAAGRDGSAVAQAARGLLAVRLAPFDPDAAAAARRLPGYSASSGATAQR